ncbi:SRPBCC family protein [Flavobacterium kingsejongi]|uniref:Polyketide cyclase n=1 Tax=Flavobacterium kingsejongi TaxID=1678728 RepID=A0A2S1LS82_9FLAO|nr:SRPBCC family protein [Flavobacterium kingsejongi]AWG26548.1 hypothetical protein FK004_15605 [Flavobacterium kingsejongi]
MRILKKILLVIIAIVLLLLVVALFIPRTYTVTVTETIHEPSDIVFNYVKLIKNQENYSVWVMQDPNIKMEYIGTDGTEGFIARWNSQEDGVGEGEQQITKVTADRIEVDLRFKRPFESSQKAATFVQPLPGNRTLITTEFYGSDAYPMNLLSLLIGRKMIRDAQTKNLENLKKILEK